MTAFSVDVHGLPKPEADFQDNIIEYATFFRWLVYHTHDSRRSEPGFPDLVLVKRPRLLLWEVKGVTKKGPGQPEAEQYEWLEELRAVAEAVPENVHTACYWPDDWPEIEAILKS